jgi:hypothetical protein
MMLLCRGKGPVTAALHYYLTEADAEADKAATEQGQNPSKSKGSVP